jgi:coenzyme F420-dependent glucose-6-phosphate dehydrogenase
VGAPEEKIDGIFQRFEKGAREAGKDPSTLPKILQLHLSWAPTDEAAMRNALTEWPNGGMKFPKADIRSPHDFAQMARIVRPEDFKGRMLISSDVDAHRREIQKFLDLGFDRVFLHNVGRNQLEWIEVFGKQVLPKLH